MGSKAIDDMATTESSDSGGVRFGDGMRKRKRLTGGAASSATEGTGRAVSEPSRGRRKARRLHNRAVCMLGRAEETATRGRNERQAAQKSEGAGRCTRWTGRLGLLRQSYGKRAAELGRLAQRG